MGCIILKSSSNIGFIGAVCSFAAVYAASSAPIPLYTIYQQQMNMTHADLSLSSVLYFVGTVIALLFLPRLSDFCGRKPIIIASLILASAGCLLFVFMEQSETFLLGRFVQGLSCGLGSACLSAYIADLAKGKTAAAVVTSAPMIGLAAGPFASAALIQYGLFMEFIYIILLAVMVVCAVFIILGKETSKAAPGALRSLLPKVSAPKNIRRFLPAASAVFVGTWAIGGFYQAFSAPIAAEQLGTGSLLIAAAVFSCLQAPNIIGSTAAGKIASPSAQKIGMIGFFFSTAAMVISLGSGAVIAFLLSSAFCGICWGMAYTGTLHEILTRITPAQRAGVLSTIYIISYSGATVPNLIVSRLGGGFNLYEIGLGYAVLVFITCALTLILRAGHAKDKDEVKKELKITGSI